MVKLWKGFIKVGTPLTCDICGAKVMEYYTDGRRIICPSCARKMTDDSQGDRHE